MPRTTAPLLCFSHLRWNFVFQRPQHVISRLAKEQPAFFWEEPEATDGAAYLELRRDGDVTIAVPRLPEGLSAQERTRAQREMLDGFIADAKLEDLTLWYYTPMARDFTRHLDPQLCVYDCMDELSLFKNAPRELTDNERELLAAADVVFTGGRSLYYAKRRAHPNVHCFPSSVEGHHFARIGNEEPDDLKGLRRPRIGFYGVIDERFDLDFVRDLAAELPDWELVFLGPVVKIDPSDLPTSSNIHYLGMKTYDELPSYLEHWDVALLPFARNDATRFISPTKTLEYLAARKPVISTPIADVVDPYGTEGMVTIADNARAAAAAARSMAEKPRSAAWHAQVEHLMSRVSWDSTVAEMRARMHESIERRPMEAAG